MTTSQMPDSGTPLLPLNPSKVGLMPRSVFMEAKPAILDAIKAVIGEIPDTQLIPTFGRGHTALKNIGDLFQETLRVELLKRINDPENGAVEVAKYRSITICDDEGQRWKAENQTRVSKVVNDQAALNLLNEREIAAKTETKRTINDVGAALAILEKHAPELIDTEETVPLSTINGLVEAEMISAEDVAAVLTLKPTDVLKVKPIK